MKYLIFICCFTFSTIALAQNSIVGTWNNDEVGTLVFNANGNGSFAGVAFTYTNTSSKIIATDNEGENYYYTYKFVNGQLIISGGIFGSPVTFTKAKSSTSSSTSNNYSKSGSIDKSIVGTWCWTNASSTYTSSSSNTRCIIVKGDGTYEYTYEGSISGSGGGYYGGSSSQSSDRGTWKVSGNTINIVSESEGAQTLSFQKKNHPKTGDPMIIIDGDAYVTYYQKNPW